MFLYTDINYVWKLGMKIVVTVSLNANVGYLLILNKLEAFGSYHPTEKQFQRINTIAMIIL